MEPISLAIGVVGLAGLFGVCLDVIDKVDSYKEFGIDSRSIVAQFDADKHLFAKWAHDVGIDRGNPSDYYHSNLDNPETYLVVHNILSSIREIFAKTESTVSILQPVVESGRIAFPGEFQFPNTSEKSQNLEGVISKRIRIGWSLRSKSRFISQVQKFGALLERLHSLVPPESLRVLVNVHEVTTGDDLISNGMHFPGLWTRRFDYLWSINNAIVFSNSQRLLVEMEKQNEHETMKELDTWLGTSWTNDIYDSFIRRRLDGTCNWILSRRFFLDWKSSDFPSGEAKILWINGPAGHGKTVLCARVVQYLSEMLQFPLAYYFCSSESEIRRNPLSIMRSWISQVISHNRDAFELVCGRWEVNEGGNASQTDIIDLFKGIAQQVPNCTFVVDGLDECAWVEEKWKPIDNESPLGFFDSIRQVAACTNTRILIFSRNEPEIRYSLRTMLADSSNQGLSEYQIRQDDVQSDAMSFSRSIMDKRLTNKSETLKYDLSQRMVNRSQGMFLWMRMLEDNLRGGKNKRQLEDTIDQAPIALGRLYDRNWAKISNLPETDKLRALSILRWVAFALRPLTILEVTEALLIEDKDSCEGLSDDELPDAIDEEYVSGEILGLCGSFLETQKTAPEQDLSSMTLHLAHFTVKQYILCNMPGQGGLLMVNERLRVSSEAFQSNTLSKLCLRYLNFQNTWQTSFPLRSGPVVRPFQDYAAGSWYHHISEYGSNYAEVVQLTNVLFSCSNGNWESWKNWIDTNSGISDLPESFKEIPSTDPLFYASLLGLRDTVLYLVEEAGACVNHVDRLNRSALRAAALKGRTSTVRLLLEKGADAALAYNNGRTSLDSALLNGHIEVVKLLLENGADVNSTSDDGCTPLYFAAHCGNIDILKLLLDNGADVTVSTNKLTALNMASFLGQVEAVKLLLQHGADANPTDNGGLTPLFCAVHKGHADVVKILLENGAVIDHPSNDGLKPLSGAIFQGHLDVVELLLGESVELDIHSREYQTVLQAATYKGSHSLMQLLIEKAKNVDMQNIIFEDALQLACIEGCMAIVEQLIHSGVNPSKVDDHGWSPSLCASWFGQGQILDYLSSSIGYRDSQSPIKTVPPSSWSTVEKSTCIELDEDLMCIRYSDNPGTTKPPAALILANHPVPLQANGYYYEIEILNSGETCAIGLGLCSKYVRLESFPGWKPVSWGYHGDNGEKYYQSTGTPYGTTFKTGDIIGCNVQLKGNIFFTLNGASLGVAFQDVSGKLYPAVGIRSRGAHVRANFGQAAFMYDVTKA